jgi:peptidoglycan hydrolase-like protein with peptidoglycan-binding domain
MAVVSLCVGLGAGTALAPKTAPDLLVAPGSVATAAAVPEPFVDRREVKVAFAFTAGQPLTANIEGTVTALSAEPGEAVESGKTALSVDAVPIVALATSMPLYRDMTRGDTGPDVRALEQELAHLGYETGNANDSRFDARTAGAVKKLRRNAGEREPDGSFQLARHVWIPKPSAIIDRWEAAPGSPVPAERVLANTGAELSSVAVVGSSAGSAIGARKLTLFGAKAELPDNGIVEDPTFLAQVAAMDDFAALRASGDHAPEEQENADAVVELVEPVDAWRVPSAAVYGVSGEEACVQADGEPVRVHVVGSSMGAALVVPESGTLSQVDLGPELRETPRRP